jgi:hypothetical protein
MVVWFRVLVLNVTPGLPSPYGLIQRQVQQEQQEQEAFL